MSAEAVKEGVSGAESAHKLLIIAALACLLFGVSQETRTTPYREALKEANKITPLLNQIKESHKEELQKFYAADSTKADFEAVLGKHYDIRKLIFIGLNDQFSMGVYPPDQKPPLSDVYRYFLLAPKFERLISFKVEHSSAKAALDNFVKLNTKKIKSIDDVYLSLLDDNQDRCELSVDLSAQTVEGRRIIVPVAPLPRSGRTEIVSSKDIVPLKEKPLRVPGADPQADQNNSQSYAGTPIHAYCDGIIRLPTEAATQLMVKSGLVSIDQEGDVTAFPALRQVWDTVKDLDLGNLGAVLSIRASAEEKANASKLSFGGLEIDSRFVRIVGPLALAGLILYLNAYLRNLYDVSRESPEAAFSYPWIRLMMSRPYGIIMAGTVFLLPVVSALSLFLRSAFQTKLDIAIFVVQALLIGLLSMMAGRSFLALRANLMRTLPANRQEQHT
jgi:hypothetical protein